tara:strand:- start:468 stop:668 length:201 start_codon:yes stop_codon:yes gene_type:complete
MEKTISREILGMEELDRETAASLGQFWSDESYHKSLASLMESNRDAILGIGGGCYICWQTTPRPIL